MIIKRTIRSTGASLGLTFPGKFTRLLPWIKADATVSMELAMDSVTGGVIIKITPVKEEGESSE